jgi:NACalpha-BTF3-like transcription factor
MSNKGDLSEEDETSAAEKDAAAIDKEDIKLVVSVFSNFPTIFF